MGARHQGAKWGATWARMTNIGAMTNAHIDQALRSAGLAQEAIEQKYRGEEHDRRAIACALTSIAWSLAAQAQREADQ